MDFLREQVLPPATCAAAARRPALGGLNYQIEHHLFPSMPMPNLPRAKPLVLTFWLEHGISYHESRLIHSYRECSPTSTKSAPASGRPRAQPHDHANRGRLGGARRP